MATIEALRIDHSRRRLTLLVLVWLGAVGVSVAVGLQMPGATAADAQISAWFADHRSMPLDKVTAVVSDMASTFVVVGIAIAVIAAGALLRRPGGIAVIVIAMVGEVTMFLTITLFVDRSRPNVPHLDPAPPTSSFPSGHAFATFVLWNAIAVLAVRQNWPAVIRWTTRVLAVVMPAAVGLSRVYRGMHHPTDVVAALVLGVVWTLAVVLVIVPGEPADHPARTDVPWRAPERVVPTQRGRLSSSGALRPVDHRS